MPPIVVHNDRLLRYMRDLYNLAAVKRLRRFIECRSALRFMRLRTHLFSTAVPASASVQSGYHHVWVRDNMHISHAFYVNRDLRASSQIMSALMRLFTQHRRRLVDVIEGRANRADPMSRPHVRFDGEHPRRFYPHGIEAFCLTVHE